MCRRSERTGAVYDAAKLPEGHMLRMLLFNATQALGMTPGRFKQILHGFAYTSRSCSYAAAVRMRVRVHAT
jgi:hypothetical protein